MRVFAKAFYISDLHIKRKKSDDVNSDEFVKDEDLTFLTFLNIKTRLYVQCLGGVLMMEKGRSMWDSSQHGS